MHVYASGLGSDYGGIKLDTAVSIFNYHDENNIFLWGVGVEVMGGPRPLLIIWFSN